MDYVLLVYSLGFVMLAAVCFTLRRAYGVRVPWGWLALFGMAHAANEWLELLGSLMYDTVAFASARTALMILSFICIFLFSRAGILGVLRKATAISERRYKSLVEASPNCIMLFDREGRCVTVNKAGLQAIGLPENEILGRLFTSLWPEQERQTIEDCIHRVLQGAQQVLELEYACPDGRLSVWHAALNPIEDEDGEIRYFVGIANDITEKRDYEAQLDKLAHQDPLTGLPNRLLFSGRLTQEIARARRKEQTLAVMFLDLDRFKLINDTLGHNTGDALLKEVSVRLKTCLRESDTIARMGGDEFTIILPEITVARDAAIIAQRILDAFSEPFHLQGHELHITTSIGISLYPTDGDDVETLVRNADTAMYRAKELGRNNYHLYTEALNAAILERLTLENSLRKAVEREEFILHYQPRVDMKTGKILGVEALLRWQHPELGLVYPAQFIPLAEETGLIVPISEWVIREACSQNKSWQDDGLAPIPVAVNISARQFQQDDLLECVKRVLDDTHLNPQYLDLELTESTLMQNPDLAIVMLRVLRAMGVKISIDDFGTGYSSLTYLKRLPIHALKVAHTFIRDLTMNPDDAAIVGAVIAMAHNLGLKVVAEGVETCEQMEFLKTLECDEIQGYLVSQPVTAEEFRQLISQSFLEFVTSKAA